MDHFNGLTPAEAERLALLCEELGEAQQAIGKILRHGYESTHPDGGPTNRETLEREIGDIYAAAQMLEDAGDVDQARTEAWRECKLVNVIQYVHHQAI